MPSETSQPQVLILHSPADEKWASEFAHLLAGIMPMPSNAVQCAVIGRLPLAHEIAEDLGDPKAKPSPRVEIGLISGATVSSPSEMFALGVRWAGVKPQADWSLIPVILGNVELIDLPQSTTLFGAVKVCDDGQLEDLIGQVAGELRIAPTQLAMHRGRLTNLVLSLRKHNPVFPPARPTVQRRFYAALVAGGFVGAAGLGALGAHCFTCAKRDTTDQVREQVSFENGVQDWNVQSSVDALGCTGFRQTSARARAGEYSLEIDVNLDGTDPKRRSGEVCLDLRRHQHETGADLSGKTISVWIYAPSDALGDKLRPNGVQLFAKDQNWRSHYGAWSNLVDEEWSRVKLALGVPNESSTPETGFQSNAIATVGVRISVGKNSNSKFSGPIYIDSLDW